jgi:hypothetical protein
MMLSANATGAHVHVRRDRTSTSDVGGLNSSPAVDEPHRPKLQTPTLRR